MKQEPIVKKKKIKKECISNPSTAISIGEEKWCILQGSKVDDFQKECGMPHFLDCEYKQH